MKKLFWVAQWNPYYGFLWKSLQNAKQHLQVCCTSALQPNYSINITCWALDISLGLLSVVRILRQNIESLPASDLYTQGSNTTSCTLLHWQRVFFFFFANTGSPLALIVFLCLSEIWIITNYAHCDSRAVIVTMALFRLSSFLFPLLVSLLPLASTRFS